MRLRRGSSRTGQHGRRTRTCSSCCSLVKVNQVRPLPVPSLSFHPFARSPCTLLPWRHGPVGTSCGGRFHCGHDVCFEVRGVTAVVGELSLCATTYVRDIALLCGEWTCSRLRYYVASFHVAMPSPSVEHPPAVFSPAVVHPSPSTLARGKTVAVLAV